MNCPKCGAERIVPAHPAARTIWWECNSYQFIDGNKSLMESEGCLRRQLAALTAELAPLRKLKAAVEDDAMMDNHLRARTYRSALLRVVAKADAGGAK